QLVDHSLVHRGGPSHLELVDIQGLQHLVLNLGLDPVSAIPVPLGNGVLVAVHLHPQVADNAAVTIGLDGRAGDRVLAIDRAADSGQLAIDVNDLHGKIAQAALQIGQLVSSLLRRILDLLPNLRQSLRVQLVQPILGRSSLRLSINQTVDTVSEISLSILQASPSILQLLIDLADRDVPRSEEHTSELQSRFDLVCRL